MTTKKMAYPLLTILPFIMVTCAWFYFAVLHPIPFWQAQGDYPWLSLSHAFTMESKIAGFQATNNGSNIHPGVPLGIASWVAFRLSTLGLSDSAVRIASTIAHTENFWMWAKITALLLNLAGVLVIQRIFKRDISRFLMAFGIYFATIPAVLGASLLQLSNESFALLYITSFYFLTYRLLTTLVASETTPARFKFIDNHDLLSFSLGALAAIGCSIKIYYMAPAIGCVIGLVTATLVGAVSTKKALRELTFFLSSFLLIGAVIIFGILGSPVFAKWISWNWEMISHSSWYGAGDKGFMQWSSVQNALSSLIHQSRGTFPLIIVALIAVLLLTLIRRAKDKLWVRVNIPFIVAIYSGIAINFMGLLKHYFEHYTLPLCASLPCLLLINSKDTLNRTSLKIGVVFVSVLILINLRTYNSTHKSYIQVAIANVRDLNAVKKLPISTEERRVWGYFSNSKAGKLPWVDMFTGSAFVSQIIKENANPIDIAPFNELDTKKWRYVIFQKEIFPTRQSILLTYRKTSDFLDTKFKINNEDKISELETSFVLTREPKE